MKHSAAFKVRRAARTVRAGGIIAYPTEGVWGLGCDPYNPAAVAEILDLKQRPMHKGLILVGGELSHFGAALEKLPKNELDQLRADPGYPLTWLIADNGSMPHWITGGAGTLAVRLSRHPLIVELCKCLDSCIVSTSANPGGRPPAASALRTRQYFNDRLDYLLPGRLTQPGGASEIRHLRSGRVIRPRGS